MVTTDLYALYERKLEAELKRLKAKYDVDTWVDHQTRQNVIRFSHPVRKPRPVLVIFLNKLGMAEEVKSINMDEDIKDFEFLLKLVHEDPEEWVNLNEIEADEDMRFAINYPHISIDEAPF